MLEKTVTHGLQQGKQRQPAQSLCASCVFAAKNVRNDAGGQLQDEKRQNRIADRAQQQGFCVRQAGAGATETLTKKVGVGSRQRAAAGTNATAMSR